MIDLFFWISVIIWCVIGAKRYPVYYKRIYAANRKAWSRIDSEETSHKETAWAALGLALIWGWYDLGVWFQNTMINVMTREEREKAEFEKAQKIVAEYTAKKEREEREAFEQQLRGE